MVRLRYVALTVTLFVFLGGVLEFVAFVIGIAFSGVNDIGHGATLPFFLIYMLGFWPDWVLPKLSAKWADVYLFAPVLWWGVVGIPIGFWIAARKNRERVI